MLDGFVSALAGLHWPTSSQLGFAVVVAGTPGPFTIALLGLGAGHGFRGGVSFLLAGAATYGAIWALAVLFTAPLQLWGGPIFDLMRYTALAVVAWIAWKLVRDDGRGGGETVRIGAVAGVMLALVNPKAWMSGLLAAAAFAGPTPADAASAGLLGVCVAALAVVLCGAWLAAGHGLQVRMRSPATRLWFNRAAAGLLVVRFVPAL